VRRSIVIALTAAALLGGCATIPPQGEWARDDTDEAARLVLYQDGEAPRPVTLTCRPGSGLIDITVVGLRRDGAVIEVHSGKIWSRYAGSGLAEDGPDAPLEIRATMNAADPVLARVADTGELTIVQGERTIHAPNAFAPAHDFLALCRRR